VARWHVDSHSIADEEDEMSREPENSTTKRLRELLRSLPPGETPRFIAFAALQGMESETPARLKALEALYIQAVAAQGSL
jgi:hypothetical protein